MKCKHCDGVGFFENGASQFKCVYCDGTGEVEQTEQEYIQSCDHKELTDILFRMIVHGSVIRPDRQYISEWLKQPHTSQTPQKQDDCPCKVKGCSFETRQACCGCIDYFKWKGRHER